MKYKIGKIIRKGKTKEELKEEEPRNCPNCGEKFLNLKSEEIQILGEKKPICLVKSFVCHNCLSEFEATEASK
jgi:DNA-directed RNA polymerase subunit RPC12/RpoP